MLEQLIARYGEEASLTVRPHVLDDGETLRWVVQIDAMDLPYADVRIGVPVQHPDIKVMMLVVGNDVVELTRWHEDETSPDSIKAGATYYEDGPPSVVESLGRLRRLSA